MAILIKLMVTGIMSTVMSTPFAEIQMQYMVISMALVEAIMQYLAVGMKFRVFLIQPLET
jgi:hypothetical protein